MTKQLISSGVKYDDEFQPNTCCKVNSPTTSSVRMSRPTSRTTWSTAKFAAASSRHRRRPLTFLRTPRARCVIFAVVTDDSSSRPRRQSGDGVDVGRTTTWFPSRGRLEPDAAAAPDDADEDCGRYANFSIAVTATVTN